MAKWSVISRASRHEHGFAVVKGPLAGSVRVKVPRRNQEEPRRPGSLSFYDLRPSRASNNQAKADAVMCARKTQPWKADVDLLRRPD
jgi:hypothetical protein